MPTKAKKSKKQTKATKSRAGKSRAQKSKTVKSKAKKSKAVRAKGVGKRGKRVATKSKGTKSKAAKSKATKSKAKTSKSKNAPRPTAKAASKRAPSVERAPRPAAKVAKASPNGSKAPPPKDKRQLVQERKILRSQSRWLQKALFALSKAEDDQAKLAEVRGSRHQPMGVTINGTTHAVNAVTDSLRDSVMDRLEGLRVSLRNEHALLG